MTIPITAIRALGWSERDKMNVILQDNGTLLIKKVEVSPEVSQCDDFSEFPESPEPPQPEDTYPFDTMRDYDYVI